MIASIRSNETGNAFGVAATYAASDLLLTTPLLFWYAGRRGPVRTKDFYVTIAPAFSAGLCSLAVLLALLGEPRLIVLDEAFNGLDPASALALKHHLRARVSEGKCSVLLATHALDIYQPARGGRAHPQASICQ